MEIVFKLLCGVLYLIGLCLGYDYKEISVYICIYGCPIVCIISALVIHLIVAYKLSKKFTVFKVILWILSGLYVALNLNFFASVCEHYNDSNLHVLFDQCVHDFQYLAETCGSTYEYCNIVIYVYLFFFVLIVNGIFSYLLKKLL